uniref:Leucine zipper transcription factor-like protein 1 n=2 Tax=Eptatretus burgeri TaxID=7764 RepID=A0A8C4NN94_EPTBU
MAEPSLNEYHQHQVVSYLRFARAQRTLRLRAVHSCIADLKESRLVDGMFTAEEVCELLDELGDVLRSELESELIHTAHTNVLLLRQLLAQAQRWHLTLQADVSTLENRELLEQIADFEASELSNTNMKTNVEPGRQKLAPLNEGEPSDLLNQEITRLKEENDKLKTRLSTVEAQATQALEERLSLEKSFQEVRNLEESKQHGPSSGDHELEEELAKMHLGLQKERDKVADCRRVLEEGLAKSRQEVLAIQAQLQLAEQELDRKFQQTAAFRNLKAILEKKNELIRDLRQRLAQYETQA